jgi:hypothetical protein
LRYRFLILYTYDPDTLYLCKEVTIRGYLSKPNGVHEQIIWEILPQKVELLGCDFEESEILFSGTGKIFLRFLQCVKNDLDGYPLCQSMDVRSYVYMCVYVATQLCAAQIVRIRGAEPQFP